MSIVALLAWVTAVEASSLGFSPVTERHADGIAQISQARPLRRLVSCSSDFANDYNYEACLGWCGNNPAANCPRCKVAVGLELTQRQHPQPSLSPA